MTLKRTRKHPIYSSMNYVPHIKPRKTDYGAWKYEHGYDLINMFCIAKEVVESKYGTVDLEYDEFCKMVFSASSKSI